MKLTLFVTKAIKARQKAVNIGARNADNEWLLFLDDDDRFANDKCQKLADVIAEHTDVNFVYHPAKCEMVNEVLAM